MSKNSKKRKGAGALIRALAREGRVTLSKHAQDQMVSRRVLQDEVLWVLEHGNREPEKDEIKGESIRYAMKGYSRATERWIRVCAALPSDQPAVVVTVVVVSKLKGGSQTE